ncbi:olfactory receptor 6M1-like [Trachemys scripta elegans]|uniref:olfactory receptor 6M1-like n=1 Tax=Trachemys scripta elegans TaxID=31138 RepID=UPI001557DB6B|nr:olfactory receptor 6M1-like [Trachemys scripta elegans]
MAGLEKVNQTTVTEFLLVGFETRPELQITLFVMFFIIYLSTVAGNILLILTVWTDHHLHTPMYFFLSNLSFLETGYVSNVIPRLLVSFLTQDKTISLPGCCLQLYVFSFLGTTECFLLTGMSYDRYLAICRPLHYVTLMNPRTCLLLAVASWTCGFVAPSFTVITTSKLAFCSQGEINHFFCDLTAVLRLSCEDTSIIKVTSLILASIITLAPFVLTITSYVYVILTILGIPSTAGRKKAFSTCSSHLIVVSTFYGALIIMYVVPSGNQSLDFNKVFSLLYTVVTPMFNPIVYSLRNKEVKDALGRVIRKMLLSPKM